MVAKRKSFRPPQKIHQRILSPLREFMQDSRAAGILLIACTALSLLLSNSSWQAQYTGFWESEFHWPTSSIALPHTFLHWINDGFMVLFFFLVGMEIKRELMIGELSSLRKSLLPVLAAIGGMLFPALIFLSFNAGTPYKHGWGIPMATDIAFSLGILSLLGNRIPLSLKIFLAALAIIDDLGAIVTIAFFYTQTLHLFYLLMAGLLLILLITLNLCKVQHLVFYYLAGIFLWYCIYNSGVHATIAGVLLAFCIPLSKIESLEHELHGPVNFIIMPLFALANTAIVVPSNWQLIWRNTIHHGILTGLLIGKPLGILLFSLLPSRLGWASLPSNTNWKQLMGVGILAGVGFTMSIFISTLAYPENDLQIVAKIAVMAASLLAGLAGFFCLRSLKNGT